MPLKHILHNRWWWIIPDETHQPAYADPPWGEWFRLPPQELHHSGRQSIRLWHFLIDLQWWRLQHKKSVFCEISLKQSIFLLLFIKKCLKYCIIIIIIVTAGVSGKFWYVSSSGLVCSDGEKPEEFFLEFLEHGRVAIKGSNGKYLRGDQGGTLMGDGTSVDASSLWEYWFLPS